jgi:hypothetical protein
LLPRGRSKVFLERGEARVGYEVLIPTAVFGASRLLCLDSIRRAARRTHDAFPHDDVGVAACGAAETAAPLVAAFFSGCLL